MIQKALIPFVMSMILPLYNVYLSFGNPAPDYYGEFAFRHLPPIIFLISWTVYYFANKSNMTIIKDNTTINWFFLISLFSSVSEWTDGY